MTFSASFLTIRHRLPRVKHPPWEANSVIAEELAEMQGGEDLRPEAGKRLLAGFFFAAVFFARAFSVFVFFVVFLVRFGFTEGFLVDRL